MRRSLLRIAAVLLAYVPLSLVVTFISLPVSSWLEATYGIGSVGHSGPAEWCYVVVYGVLNLLVFATLWYRWKSASSVWGTKGLR